MFALVVCVCHFPPHHYHNYKSRLISNTLEITTPDLQMLFFVLFFFAWENKWIYFHLMSCNSVLLRVLFILAAQFVFPHFVSSFFHESKEGDCIIFDKAFQHIINNSMHSSQTNSSWLMQKKLLSQKKVKLIKTQMNRVRVSDCENIY